MSVVCGAVTATQGAICADTRASIEDGMSWVVDDKVWRYGKDLVIGGAGEQGLLMAFRRWSGLSALEREASCEGIQKVLWEFRAWARREGGMEFETSSTGCPLVHIDLMMLTPGGLFVTDVGLGVSRVRDFLAIGSGGASAMGAMEVQRTRLGSPAALVREGVEVAGRCNKHCAGVGEVFTMNMHEQPVED